MMGFFFLNQIKPVNEMKQCCTHQCVDICVKSFDVINVMVTVVGMCLQKKSMKKTIHGSLGLSCAAA